MWEHLRCTVRPKDGPTLYRAWGLGKDLCVYGCVYLLVSEGIAHEISYNSFDMLPSVVRAFVGRMHYTLARPATGNEGADNLRQDKRVILRLISAAKGIAARIATQLTLRAKFKRQRGFAQYG